MSILQIGKYSVRKIKEEDLPLLFAWRNSEKVHSFMLTDHKISWQEHEQWFAGIKDDKTPVNLIFEQEGVAAGYIGYSQLDEVNRNCLSGVYIGSGLDLDKMFIGVVIGEITLEYAFNMLKMHKVCAYVFEKNKRALKLNEYLGYEREGLLRQHFLKDNEYLNVVVQGVLRTEWNTIKNKYLLYN